MTGNEIRLGPDDLVGREFAIGLRGYDRDEVDAFLLQAADAWRQAMATAPSGGLSSTAMAALAETEGSAADDPSLLGDPYAGSADPYAAAGDPFATPNAANPFDAAPFSAPATPEPEFVPPAPPLPPEPQAQAPAPAPFVPEVEPAAPVLPPAAEVPGPSRAEVDRDRAAAYAERVAAELDRAAARTELAQAQEEKLRVIDEAQRRADAVLSGARARAQAEAEAVLEDARTRLTPLLEQERAARARLARLRQDLEALTGEVSEPAPAALPDPAGLVTAAEDDPDTPEAPFPVGYGSVTV